MAEITAKSTAPKGTTAPTTTPTQQAQPTTSDPEYEAWQESGSPGWGWSSEGGWTYDGESVPSGPTTTPGVAYDASKDPSLTGGGEAPAPKAEPTPAPAPPKPSEPSAPKVIGTSPTTGEVLVKDAEGNMYWKPGTAGQIEQATQAISRLPETQEARLADIPYTPPEGVGYEQPAPGSLVEEPKKSATTAKVYTFRGDVKEVPVSDLQAMSQLKGEEQYQKAVDLGILQEGKFVEGEKPDQWGYIPQWQIDAKSRFETQMAQAPPELQEAYQTGGVDAYNKAVGEHNQKLEQERATFEANHIIIGGMALPVEVWNKLDPKYQSIALRDPKGFEAVRVAQVKDEADFNRTHTDIGDGRYLPNEAIDRIKTETPDLYKVFESKGYDAFISELDRLEASIKAESAALAKEANLKRTQAQQAIATSVQRMNLVASPDFFKQGGSSSERSALSDALRRAGIPNPSVATYNNLSPEEKARVATHFYPEQDVLKDILKEIMTIGQAKTTTFNEDDLRADFKTEEEIARAIYRGDTDAINKLYDEGAFGNVPAYMNVRTGEKITPEEYRAMGSSIKRDEFVKSSAKDDTTYMQALQYTKESKGVQKAESEDDFIVTSLGTESDYAREVLKTQPLLGDLAKEFIPFRQLTPSEIEKTKESGAWFDFGVRTLFDIALVVPIIGWIGKGAQAGLRAASIGSRVAALGGRNAVSILKNEAKNAITNEIGKTAMQRIEVKAAQNALKKAVAEKSVDAGLRKEALDLARASLRESRLNEATRIATARSNYRKLDDLYKAYTQAVKANPLKVSLQEKAYQTAVKATGLSSQVSKPAWYAYGGAEAARTARDWDKSSGIEKLISLGMIGLAFGVPEKIAGMTKSGYEILTDPGRIPSRTIAVPDVYLPKGAGMPKTSVRGMSQQEQLQAMQVSSQAMEDLWSGVGSTSYRWGTTGLKYSPRSEFQRVIPKSMISATPSGEIFKSPVYKVVVLREPAQYFAPWGFPKFTKMSASGAKGSQPAYLVLFGSKLERYPKMVELAKTPAEVKRIVLDLLEQEALKKGMYPGFKLYRSAKEPEFIVPAGTEIGAGRSTIMGRIYGGVPLWTRATPFGKKIELQPHFVLGDEAARRSGFTLAEAHGLKMLGLSSEIKHWIDKAQFWKRGIAGEEGVGAAVKKAVRRETEPLTEKLGAWEFETERGFKVRIKSEIDAAKKAGNAEQVKYLKQLEKNTLREFREANKVYRDAITVYDELLRLPRDLQVRRLLEEFRLLSATRRAFFRGITGRMLERLRTDYGTAQRVDRPELARVAGLRAEPTRPETTRPEAVRPEITRPEAPRTTLSRIDIPRIETPRPEGGRPEPERVEPERPEPIRPEPERPEPTRPEPTRPEPTRPEPTRPVPTRPEPVRPAPIQPPPPRIMARLVAASPAGVLIPEGSIAWAQGSLARGKNRVLRPQWWYIPPPYDLKEAISLSAPPHGAKFTDSIVPMETIQVIGSPRSKVPRLVRKDLGWTDIEIVNGREIRFTSGGEKTDVGTRRPETGRGIEIFNGGGEEPAETSMQSVEDVELDKDTERALDEFNQPKVVNRPAISKKQPTRKGKKKLTEWEYMTTLKGFRF